MQQAHIICLQKVPIGFIEDLKSDICSVDGVSIAACDSSSIAWLYSTQHSVCSIFCFELRRVVCFPKFWFICVCSWIDVMIILCTVAPDKWHIFSFCIMFMYLTLMCFTEFVKWRRTHCAGQKLYLRGALHPRSNLNADKGEIGQVCWCLV